MNAAPIPAILEPVEIPRVQLHLCRACEMDMCEVCFEGPCSCACQDWFPKVIRQPKRCRRCGYLKTAPGHWLSCEQGDDGRLMRLADSIGRKA